MDTSLESKDLAAGYANLKVLDKVTLGIKRGELVVVLGPNAAGKSTLLKTLAGLLWPLGGVVYIDGIELTGLRPTEIAKRVGLLLTDRLRMSRMTAMEVVSMGRYPYTGPLARLSERDRLVVRECMMLTGTLELSERPFDELSDGQKQKVMLARALAQEPRVLILDEPTTHLDPRNRVEVCLLLKRITETKGISAIASLHDVELALRIADKLLVVSSGSVALYESPEEFVYAGGVGDLYGFNRYLSFDERTMTIEVRANSQDDDKLAVFVIAGGGTGALVYRALVRQGHRVSTGILHSNDVDYSVARGLGIEVISEKPFEEIKPETFASGKEALMNADVVVYTNPPLGTINALNSELVRFAHSSGKTVINVDVNRKFWIQELLRSMSEASTSVKRNHLIRRSLYPGLVY
ncbi:MAG: ABC transporter ATP-binding protein [Aigarchaeota archaeon]|nr:ABC transporter ATP-binding protein [Aigarchaeota archaeon]MDW8092898.1 ABC transporter ATP-binding protein [Nitrososphaerota archaeon]